ncbi:MHYT domain-containing protein [Magnetovibrio sp.]|uniref:MHYT domain-containing protein n=1 Tax=Magnetovibrio sp. TaxID=2024836 RepID=UPI002F950434
MGSYLQFLDPTQDLSLAFHSEYSIPLVILSVLTAVFASFMALQLADRIRNAQSLSMKIVWLCPGALALGGGVWAMHFIGMLAFSLPCGITYDPVTTLLSMFPGILASAVALWVIGLKRTTLSSLLMGGVLMGSGIGTMHYAGMAAMRLDAVIYYSPTIFAVSIVFSILLAMLSLYAKIGLHRQFPDIPDWSVLFLSALLMGLSISGMHYIAMEAAYFIPVGETTASTPGISPTVLAIGIGTITALAVALALAAVILGKHLETIKVLNHEISERMRSEDEMRKMSRAVQQSPVTVVITDRLGNIEYVNPKFTQTTGYSAEEAIGQNPRILKSGDKLPGEYQELWDTILAGKEWRGEFHNKRKDGTHYWEAASISPIRAEDGTITNFMAIKEDITERKKIDADLIATRTQAELDAAQEKVLENLMRLSLATVSMEEYLNKAISSLINDVPWLTLLHQGGIFLTTEQGAGDGLELIAGYKLHPQLMSLCAKVPFGYCLCGRAAVSREIMHADCIDDRHDISFDGIEPHGHYIVPLLQEETVLGMITLYLPHGYQKQENDVQFLRRVSDVLSIGISRRYDARELRQAKEDAEAANHAKSEFLSSMSHELRTPLNAILGFGQLLDYNPKEPLTPAQKDSVKQIMSGGQHLLNLINDVLDLAKIEAGKVQLSIENVSVKTVLNECLSLTQTLADKRGIRQIVGEGFQTNKDIRVDHTRFKQSLLNLMSNAVKYNKENGSVTLDCHETLDGMLHISVTDTGEGIPEEKYEELFKPFNRLDAENTEIEGTGIGLTITKQLIERMDGHIGVVSEVGQGSTFWLELPCSEAKLVQMTDEEELDAERKDAYLPGIDGTVLYVEDNPANLSLMEMIVQQVEGLSMISAHNAELGIEMARTQKPDLIIMDINLPGMNGYEALAKLQSLSEIKNIPVIALSANAMPKDIEKGIAAGFRRYLTKPIVVDEIVYIMKDIVEGLQHPSPNA